MIVCICITITRHTASSSINHESIQYNVQHSTKRICLAAYLLYGITAEVYCTVRERGRGDDDAMAGWGMIDPSTNFGEEEEEEEEWKRVIKGKKG